MTIEDDPRVIGNVGKSLSMKDLNAVENFIMLNKDILLDYWNMDIVDISEVLDRIEKV